MSSQSASNDEDDDVWEEDWGDNDESECISLFSTLTLPSVDACCDHDAKVHGFDLRSYCAQHALDDYGVLRCINFIRSVVAAGQDPLPGLARGPLAFADEKYLQPVLQDDGMLCHDFTAVHGERAGCSGQTQLEHRVHSLQTENAALLDAIEQMRALAVPAELQAELRLAHDAVPTSVADSTVAASPAQASMSARDASDATVRDVDRAYFDSYSYFDIHREMLQDTVRTNAYRTALERNPSLMQGATVLDVGCGTGVLSMFAARGGAARVVGVDAADRITPFAEKNCIANNLHESVGGAIAIVQGKAEELHELPGVSGKVDVIVSEWMGYALLFESMLGSVLRCRDRWLKSGGAMLPDRATICVAAGSETATGLDFWDNVYGLSFPAIKDEIATTTRAQPLVAPVDSSALLSDAATIKEFDLTSMTSSDADFHSHFELTIRHSGACRALVLWFDTPFTERFCSEAPCVLSTSPHSQSTHWVQTVFLLDTAIAVQCGEYLRCRCSFASSGRHRSIDISFEVEHVLADGKAGARAAQAYTMEVSSTKDSD